MSLTLALMFCERELAWAKLHLPVYLDAFCSAEGKLNIVAASDEVSGLTADYLRSLGIPVLHVPFGQNWSAFWNCFMERLHTRGVTKVLRLDLDELIFPTDVPTIDALLDTYSFLTFPRYNFWYDRTRWHRDGAYPDLQGRAWRLDGRERYVGARHEGIIFSGPESEKFTADIHFFHYGDIGVANIKERALRYWNYDLMDKGLPLVAELPPEIQPGAATVLFELPQPLDPKVCGLTAPFDK